MFKRNFFQEQFGLDSKCRENKLKKGKKINNLRYSRQRFLDQPLRELFYLEKFAFDKKNMIKKYLGF